MEGEWSTPRPGRFTPEEEARYPLYRRLGGPQGRFGRLRKITPLPGFDHRTLLPEARAVPTELSRFSWNRGEDDIKIYLKGVGLESVRLILYHINKAAGCCEHGNEPPGSIRCWYFPEWQRDSYLLENSFTPWGLLLFG
jgi:hypothetical protein